RAQTRRANRRTRSRRSRTLSRARPTPATLRNALESRHTTTTAEPIPVPFSARAARGIAIQCRARSSPVLRARSARPSVSEPGVGPVRALPAWGEGEIRCVQYTSSHLLDPVRRQCDATRLLEPEAGFAEHAVANAVRSSATVGTLTLLRHGESEFNRS